MLILEVTLSVRQMPLPLSRTLYLEYLSRRVFLFAFPTTSVEIFVDRVEEDFAAGSKIWLVFKSGDKNIFSRFSKCYKINVSSWHTTSFKVKFIFVVRLRVFCFIDENIKNGSMEKFAVFQLTCFFLICNVYYFFFF